MQIKQNFKDLWFELPKDILCELCRFPMADHTYRMVDTESNKVRCRVRAKINPVQWKWVYGSSR